MPGTSARSKASSPRPGMTNMMARSLGGLGRRVRAGAARMTGFGASFREWRITLRSSALRADWSWRQERSIAVLEGAIAERIAPHVS
jgi:hypothetical protein